MGDTRSPTFCRHGIGSQSSSWSKARKQRIHSHDDVIKWKHFPRYWPFVQGIHRSPVNSPHKGQWRGALMFSLICTWINGWENNREAGDLRGHRAHYDVTVMNRLSGLLPLFWLHGINDWNPWYYYDHKSYAGITNWNPWYYHDHKIYVGITNWNPWYYHDHKIYEDLLDILSICQKSGTPLGTQIYRDFG